MLRFIFLAVLTIPRIISGQGFVDPCGTGFDPFDHTHQLLFDSCFRTQNFVQQKSCTIAITDSFFTTGKPEEINVTFDTSGRPILLQHVMEDAGKISCALISCMYENNLFYSTHIQGADSAITHVFREYKSPDGRYREDRIWYQSDTTMKPDVISCFFKSIAGRDSCIKSYTKRSGNTFQFLTKVIPLNDTTEERTYMNINYRWSDSEGDTTYSRRTITYNSRKQIVKKEYYAIKQRIKYTWTYIFNSKGRLTGYTYHDSYGKAEAFSIERDDQGLPTTVRCYGAMYRTIYKFKWK